MDASCLMVDYLFIVVVFLELAHFLSLSLIGWHAKMSEFQLFLIIIMHILFSLLLSSSVDQDARMFQMICPYSVNKWGPK